jgi:isopentenyldiphosphate isomerase
VVGDLIEHEVDHVFVGFFAGEPSPNPQEVGAWRWVAQPALAAELARSPERFSSWFPRALQIATAFALSSSPSRAP